MKKILFVLAILAFGYQTSYATENGVISVKSELSVEQTMNKFEKILKSKGVTIFARVNHAKGAKSVGKNLRDTELLIFGNPKLGTPLLTSNQLIGLDLPLKALAWQDKQGDVWLSYNAPKYLAHRHSVDNRDKVIKKMTGILKKLTAVATKK